jgi:uncharacterized protein YkwD
MAPAPTRADAPSPCDLKRLEYQVFVLVNQARAGAGLAPYTRAPELDASARVHSLDMATTGNFNHAGTDGSSPFDRMTAAGYVWTNAAENIAAGQTTAQAAMDTWMNEPPDASGHRGHRESILSADLKEIGISVVYQDSSPFGYYWTQDFGARAVVPTADTTYNPDTRTTDCTTTGATTTGTTTGGGATPNTGTAPTGTEPGTLHLTAVTSDGKLWHTIRYTNGNWAPFSDVKAHTGAPGSIVAAAVQVIGSGAGSALHLGAITSDGRLWHTIRQSDGSWLPFGDVAARAGDRGQFVSVALANVNDELHVCGVTSDGKLWHTIRDSNGNWTPFGDVKGQSGDPGTFTRVAATMMTDASTGAQELYVLGVTSNGQLYETVRHPDGTWSPFVRSLQGVSDAFVESGVTFARAGGGTRLYLAPVSSAGQFWLATESFGAVGAADQLEPLGSLLPSPVTHVSVGLASDVSQLVQMAVVTADGGLWHQIGSPGAWPGFGDVKGQAGDPGMVVSVSVDGLR